MAARYATFILPAIQKLPISGNVPTGTDNDGAVRPLCEENLVRGLTLMNADLNNPCFPCSIFASADQILTFQRQIQALRRTRDLLPRLLAGQVELAAVA